MLLVLAPPPAAIDAPQAGGRGVGEFSQHFIAVAHGGLAFLDDAVGTGQEAVGTLQLEALPLAVFVIDGNTFHRHGFHGFYAIEFPHPVVLCQQGITVFAAVDQGVAAARSAQVTIPALAADQGSDGGQLAVAGNVIRRSDVEFGPHHAIHAALMIDETARTELRESQKTRAADHAAFVLPPAHGVAATGGNPCHQG